MDNKFKVVVNKDLDFNITEEDISKIDALQTVNATYHILQNNKPFLAEIVHSDFNTKNYIVKVNNSSYNVAILDKLDLLIKEMGFSLGSTKNINSIEAPMPGLILDINVAAEEEVKEGDALLILEAMKMENIITSPRDGIIKSVAVNKGEAVLKKQLLIEFK